LAEGAGWLKIAFFLAVALPCHYEMKAPTQFQCKGCGKWKTGIQGVVQHAQTMKHSHGLETCILSLPEPQRTTAWNDVINWPAPFQPDEADDNPSGPLWNSRPGGHESSDSVGDDDDGTQDHGWGSGWQQSPSAQDARAVAPWQTADWTRQQAHGNQRRARKAPLQGALASRRTDLTAVTGVPARRLVVGCCFFDDIVQASGSVARDLR